METKTKRFDYYWRKALRAHDMAVKHSNDVRASIRLFMRSAYRFTEALLEIQKNHHNEFLDHCRLNGIDVNNWMNEHYEAIEAMGDDRRTIMAAVEQGMTEKEYIEQGQLWAVRNRMKTTKQASRTDIQKSRAADLSPEEEIAALRSENAAMKSEIRLMRRDLATALKACDRLQRSVKRADRILADVA